MSNTWFRGVVLTVALGAVGCGSETKGSSGSEVGSGGSSTTATSGGATSAGGTTTASSSTGGTSATTGGSSAAATGGASAATGGASTDATGGKSSTGGTTSKGGSSTMNTKVTGGATGAGGKATGGETTAGGGEATGGVASTGGVSTGGGGKAAGGTKAVGGETSAGGTSTAGGAATGGVASTGGTTSTSTDVTVQLDQTKQEMAGFGINNNWAPGLADNEADELFNTTGKGIGLSILRIGMGSDGNHFNTNSPADIQKAKARGVKYIIGSTWSPPANCKSNNNENDGGHLLESCFASWSDKLAKFAGDNSLYAMSIGNEPDFASCGMTEPCNGNYPTTLYTAAEMVKFIKVAGPKIQAKGVKVIAPEASEWIHNWSNISATGSEPSNKNSSDPLKCGCFGNVYTAELEATCSSTCKSGGGYDYGHWFYQDSAAWAALDIMGVHQYDTHRAEPWPADVPDKKPVWQTEMSGVKWWPEQGPSSDIRNGIAVAGWIHDAVTVGEAAAWLWWWYKAYNTDDNEGLYLKNGTDTKRHYTLGNYSKFIRPGYTRVDITGNVPANVLLSAFKGTDGTVVIVAINKGTAAATVPITIAGGTAPASLTPWVTSSSDNLASKTAVSVSGGSFTASLGASTVTTFVGK